MVQGAIHHAASQSISQYSKSDVPPNPRRHTRSERAMLNVLQALEDAGATEEVTAVRTYEIDRIVGDLSRYAQPNTTIIKSLLRYQLIGLNTEAPMKI